MNILVTGGAGYIGSHTVLELLRQGYDVVAVDNLCNSSAESLKRVEQLAGKKIPLYIIDLCDEHALTKVFVEHHIDAVIHFAGLKAVGESIAEPLRYYTNNLVSTLTLCNVMAAHDVRRMVFSSSATVYGVQSEPKCVETMERRPSNPYGHTKAMIEQILQDLCASKSGWQISLLRYFNPVGADASGKIGEDPNGIPNNLFPFIAQVAVGKREKLSVWGNDYDTPDGTGIRDYIHVTDLAKGHIAALEHMPKPNTAAIYNLGSGKGCSVLEAIEAFRKASGRPIPYEVKARRPGDLAICYANPDKAERELGWHTEKTLDDMCADAWRWQSQNPNGYK